MLCDNLDVFVANPAVSVLVFESGIRGGAARKLDQYAAWKIDHLRDVDSTRSIEL
jgi:hypothetical protein